MKRAFPKNRCRVCLGGAKKLNSIFEQQGGVVVSQKIMSIAQVTISDDDTLPHLICNNCLVRIKHCYAFKLMCERADKKLRQIKSHLNEAIINNFAKEINRDPIEIKTENITSQTVLLPNYKETDKIMISEFKQLKKCEEAVSKSKDLVPKCDEPIPEPVPQLVVHIENVECSDNEENFDRNDMDKDILHKISAVKKLRGEMHTIEESEQINESCEGNDGIQNTNQRVLHSETLPSGNEVSRQEQKERGGNSEKDEVYCTHGKISHECCEVKNTKYIRKPNKKHPSQCHECHKVLSSKGEKPFGCSTCNKTFAWESSRAQHERIHSGDNRYKCDLCSVSFPTVSQLSYHRRKHTGERHKCEICEKSYISPGDLSAHVRTKHESGRQYVCSVCGGAFIRLDHLKRHTKLHENGKPLRAIAEKKTRDVPASLAKACRERQHVCSVCGSRFYRPDHLERHMKLHSGSIPFLIIAKKKSLDVPDSTVEHSGETHKCETCETCFVSAEDMTAHINTKHQSAGISTMHQLADNNTMDRPADTDAKHGPTT